MLYISALILDSKWNLSNLPFDEYEYLLKYLNPQVGVSVYSAKDLFFPPAAKY